MKKSRLQELAGIAKLTLNEGYAWEREENGALPTLASSTAKHAANQRASVQETTSLNEVSGMKSNIDQRWKTADDMAGDMQQWLSGIYGSGNEDMYEEVMNILANLADNFDPSNDL